MQKDKRQRNKRGKNREERDEFDQQVLDLARVTRVMAGGKRMRFRAAVAVGDRSGRIGVGVAKGADVQMAISKAVNDAKKNIIKVKLTDTGTIPHEVRIKNHSAQLLIKPAPSGTGIIAGSVVRQIFDLAGISDIVGKIMGTGNNVNNAKAVIESLSRLRDPKKAQKKDTPQKQAKEFNNQESQNLSEKPVEFEKSKGENDKEKEEKDKKNPKL